MLQSLLDRDSSTAVWVVLRALIAAGLGLVIITLLPAVQASPPKTEAVSTNTIWAFVRNHGIVRSVAVFNNRLNQLLPETPDAHVRSKFSNRRAYEQG